MKTCHEHIINSQISEVIGVDSCLNSQIGADPFNLLTIESKGKPSKEELYQNQRIQLKPEKKQSKPSDEEFRPELNQNLQIQLKPEKKQGKPSNEEFRQELNQSQQTQLKPKKKQGKPSNKEFRPELNQN